MEYGRIKYDIFFKKVFGKKPHITRAFLNTVLRDDLKSPIETVTFRETEFIVKGKSALINRAKHDVIDILCVDQAGNRILIEIQKGGNRLAIPRFLDYQCRNYSSQFVSGDLYDNVVGCYSICWMFDILPPHSALSEKIRLCSNEQETEWVFDWQITALYPRNLGSLEELKKTLQEQHQISLEEWLILDVVTDNKKAAEIKNVLQHKEIQEAFEDLDLSGYTESQLREAEYMSEYGDLIERDLARAEKKRIEALKKAEEQAEKKRIEALKKAEEEAEKKRIEALKKAEEEAEKKRIEALKKAEEQAEKKRQESLFQQKLEMAKSMLQFTDLETISKVTGISIEELEKLKS